MADQGNSHPTQMTQEILREGLTEGDRFHKLYRDIEESQLSGNDEILTGRVGPMAQPQLYQLQSQVLAYKHLIRNIPVPTNLNWTGLHSNLWPS